MRAPAIGLALILVLAACQPSATASPSASASAVASAAPSEPAPSGSEVACDPAQGVVCNGPLPAGDYVSEGTGAHIEFTLDDHDWSGLAEAPGVGFGLLLADVPDSAISALAFTGEYFTDACDSEAGTSTIEPTPAEFMAMLAGRPGVTASDPIEVEVGGRPGLQVDLTTAVSAECAATNDGQISVWPMHPVGPFDFEDQEMARMIAVDAGSATVILIAEARSIVEDYDHFLEHFTEVIDSMTITPIDSGLST
jgi:hypothetical protein